MWLGREVLVARMSVSLRDKKKIALRFTCAIRVYWRFCIIQEKCAVESYLLL